MPKHWASPCANKPARVLVAVVICAGALLCLLPTGCNGFPRSCQDTLRYHETDLMQFCVTSGKCQYRGLPVVCRPASQAYCNDLCGDAGAADCVRGCVGGPMSSCPYYNAPDGGDWEFPLDALGSARDGLGVLHVTGVPAYEGHITVSADGKVLCTTPAGYPTNDPSLTLDCPLPGQPSWVRVDASDQPEVYLREPTPTKHVQLCGA